MCAERYLTSAKFFLAYILFLLSAAALFVSGAWFERLGASSLLAMLATTTSTAGLILPVSRLLLCRVSAFILALWVLRISGSVLGLQGMTLLEFVLLWFLLLLVWFTGLHACVLPLDIGVISSLLRVTRTRTNVASTGDKQLWYLDRFSFRPTLTVIGPLALSLAAWGVHTHHAVKPVLGFDATSAVASGLFYPFGTLAAFVFAVRSIDAKATSNFQLKFDRYPITWKTFATAVTLVYLCGLLLEYGGAGMYALWSVCAVVLSITVACLGRVTSLSSSDSQFVPVQFVQESVSPTINLRHIILASLLIFLFSLAYYQLLSSILTT